MFGCQHAADVTAPENVFFRARGNAALYVCRLLQLDLLKKLMQGQKHGVSIQHSVL
jgi:hypothetical protein